MNTRRSDTLTFQASATAFIKEVEETLDSDQAETLFDILASYDSMLMSNE
jgi:hypothetical protein